jgi:GTP-binding protein
MFIDQAEIWVKAGDGGSGCISFRREKYVPKGGPDGGDGGDGGNVICQAAPHLRTLLDLKYRRQYKAENGRPGQGANKFGKNGKDVIIKVPKGTLIKNLDTGEILGDLVEDNQQLITAKGGKGGRGNARFATPTNQAPRKYELGKKGESRNLCLELKLLADIGLVGFPNAGKSTFLSRISAARPKIADYPFTTLTPNLGIVHYRDHNSFVVADIPGLIEGAHHGKGLGIQFLRHIERTRVIAFLIESQSQNMIDDIKTLKNELKEYDANLLEKPSFIVITKMDLISSEESEKFTNLATGNFEWCKISSVTGQGIENVKSIMWNYLQESDNQ